MSIAEDSFVDRCLEEDTTTTVSEFADELEQSERYQLLFALGEAYADGTYDEDEVRVREDRLYALKNHSELEENWLSEAVKTGLEIPHRMVADNYRTFVSSMDEPEKNINSPRRMEQIMNKPRAEIIRGAAPTDLAIGLATFGALLSGHFFAAVGGTTSLPMYGATHDSIEDHYEDLGDELQSTYDEIVDELGDREIRAYHPAYDVT